MIAVLAGFLAAVALGIVGLHGRAAAEPRAERFASTLRVALPALTLAAAFAVQLAIVTVAARSQVPFPSWFAALPAIVIDDRGPLFGHAPVGPAIGLCVLVQTLAGVALYRAGRGRRFGRVANVLVAGLCAAMLWAAIATPALTSFDLYAYAGSAHAADAYNPPRTAFAGQFALINRIYGVPIFPSPYGPVWLALVKLAVAPFASLGAQIVALRCVGALAIVAAALALRALRFSPVEVALVALNPGLIGAFVLDGHNDAVPIALVLWAIALQQRLPGAAVVLGILAGGMKLPFLAIGTLAFARAASPRVRVSGAAAILTGGLALSAVLGGPGYLRALRVTSLIYHPALADAAVNVLHALLGLAALAALALAIGARRYWPSAAWSFVAFAAAFFGWYVAWGLPYAALERRWLAAFLLSLPALTFLLSTVYAASLFANWATLLAIAASPLAVYVTLRRIARPRRPLAAGR